MQKDSVWIAITKSKPLPGCEIDVDGCEFYYADILVPLKNDTNATAMVSVIKQAQEALLEDKLELAEVLLCAKFLPEEWVDQTDGVEPLHELATKAVESQAIVFGGFRSEEIQELYQYKHTVQEMDE